MADATAHIAPHVLAAALRDLEGVALDPSTDEGALASARIVERLMSDEQSAERLMQAVERHADAVLAAEPALPARYGAVATTETALPADATQDVPPIGSPEFEAFMDEPAAARESDRADRAMAALPVADPSELGFDAAAAAPPTRAEVDAALRELERVLEHQTRRHSWAERLRAAVEVFRDRDMQDWAIVALPLARNRFVVEARRKDAWWRWESIAAGDSLYVLLVSDGGVAFKDRVPLTDHAGAQQRLAAAFADEPFAGARTLRALRMAMSGGTHAPRAGT